LPLEIVGEFRSLADVDGAGVAADAVLMDAVAPVSGERDTRAGARETRFEAGGRLSQDERVDEPLTPRELEVLELLAEGLPNKAIAERLGISDQTVKFHVSSITGKLATSNRTEAVRRALRKGLISL
jgi:DNA-binding NarL/FixJ family response regulator